MEAAHSFIVCEKPSPEGLTFAFFLKSDGEDYYCSGRKKSWRIRANLEFILGVLMISSNGAPLIFPMLPKYFNSSFCLTGPMPGISPNSDRIVPFSLTFL